MNFLLMVIVTIIEVLVIYRIRFVYSRQPVGAIVLSSTIIAAFYLLAKFTINRYVRAFSFSLATIDLIFLVIMLFYMWQMNRNLKQLQKIQQTDFLLVLGNKCTSSRIPPILAERLDKAIELYKSFPVKPKIIVSGGRLKPNVAAEAELMQQYLIDAGIPAEMILSETQSRTTVQNLGFSAIKIRNIWHKDSRPRVIIVTSDYHLPRTKFYVKKLGLKVNFAAAKTVKMLMWPEMFREFTAILWYYRYSLFTILGMDILFSLSMCM
ncbi:YdcF family protein [Companilactobacillus nantensis]|uniref:YdcF family protein n=1 Tax=Companilactobacillus nantensis TaxID=305793 RepID=UPI0007101611|nr:YdcF family protein [Companilactobacillus nantensis]GEO64911.1 hypothetical protein LNA01_20940 [Companilactobacillus nantensis]